MGIRSLPHRTKILVVLLAGLAMRLALLWMPGTEDMYFFRTWGALALRSGIVKVYTWKDEVTLDAIFMKRQGIDVRLRTIQPTEIGPAVGVPDYPPGNILFLEISAGLCRMLQGGVLRAGYLLNACLNLLPVLFALAAALAVWRFAEREGAPHAGAAIAALWLNPALILTSPVLGYQDPIFAFFGLLALTSFYRGRHTASALFLALSCLTKPQGVFIVPVLAAAFWADGGWRLLARGTTRFLLFLLIPLLPYVVAGRLLAPVAAMARGAVFPALSAQTVNVWWLAGPTAQSLAAGSWGPLLGKIEMIPQGDFRALAGFDPIWLSLPALILFTLVNIFWLMRELSAGNRSALFWSAALQVYGYTMLALFVHENHLYAFFVYAAPLLVAVNGFYARAYWGLSAIYALNLYLFDGLGEGINVFNDGVRLLPGFDLTALLSLINLIVFGLLFTIALRQANVPGRRGVPQDSK